MRILYLTHYSIMEPLGQSQILPYLMSLSERGHEITIVSFEKGLLLEDQSRLCEQSDDLGRSGISWFPHRYRGGASLRWVLLDILQASKRVRKLCKGAHIDLLHCRAHVPFLMAWYASFIHGIPILFDFRGFLAEEYVDAGLWKRGGLRFRLTKWLEHRMAGWCSSMVVLTHSVRDYMRDAYAISAEKLFVVPCCVDLRLFCAARKSIDRSADRSIKVVYSGSTDGRYDVLAMLSFFSRLLERRPGSHFTILSTGDLARVRAAVEDSRVPRDSVSIKTLPHRLVPEALSEHDLGLFFLRGGLALLAASPTKIGEYLASGLIVVAEEGTGGQEEVLVQEGVGCLTKSDNPALWDRAIDEALRLYDQPDIRRRSIATAAKYYSLAQGVETYLRAYEFAIRSAL